MKHIGISQEGSTAPPVGGKEEERMHHHIQRGRRRPLPLAAAALAATALIAAGCGSSNNNNNSSSSTSSSSSGSSAKGKSLTLVAGVKGDEFYITMNCGAQAEAKKLGVSLDFQGPDQFDAGQQTPIVNAVAAKKPAAVLIAPTDSAALYAPIKQLADGGTKVVLVDTTLDNPGVAVSEISSNNEAGGTQAAQALGKLIGGKGKVLVVNVKPGISTTDARAKGFESGIKSQPGLTYLGQQYSNDDPAKAASIVKSVLAKNPDLKGIFATNLFSAEGSASGLREAGKLGKVKIISFDAGPKQVQDLKDGLVQGLIAQQPADIGAQGVQQAVNAIEGKPNTKVIRTGFVTVTKDNINDPATQKALYKANC
jgi:ribose transport system substrate-binding protein